VRPGGLCIPLEGEYRIQQLDRDEWYVLGRNEAIACESESAARTTLDRVTVEHDAHALAAEALEGLPAEFEVVARQA
jgi:hypothetical protein